MVKVIIKKETKILFKYKKLFEQIAEVILKNEKITQKSEINIIIVDNNKIKEISNKYKNINKPTDVLSFPNDWKELSKFIGYNMFGDIFISKEKITTQAKNYGHSKKREWCYLFAHGLLHLVGYDHKTKKDESQMNNKANKALEELGVKR